MQKTYSRIFSRLGLEHRIVEADSGAIGGSGSKEFMVVADSGEDTLIQCTSCGYAANVEAAKRQRKNITLIAQKSQAVSTPFIKTIDELSSFFGLGKEYFVKTIAKKALYDEGHSAIVLFCIRGSDELEETKAKNSVGANDLIDVSEEELIHVGLIPGFMGPQVTTVKVVVDEEIATETSIITGGNSKDIHLSGVDISALSHVTIFDLLCVNEGDNCPCCQQKLSTTKGIEVGHIFQLGERYSAPLKAQFLDENGKARNFVMGTYGIGVSRLLAAIIEQHHDEKGCRWTKESAPYSVHIIVSNSKDEEQTRKAEELYTSLINTGIETLLDDRNERFGPKMADFELIGIPFGIIVGKGVNEGTVEIVSRSTLEKTSVSIDAVLPNLQNALKELA